MYAGFYMSLMILWYESRHIDFPENTRKILPPLA